MSIQLTKRNGLFWKVQRKLGLVKKADKLSAAIQKVVRLRNRPPIPVYYNYHHNLTHPYIRERMYGAHAPTPWATQKNALISHFLAYPEDTNVAHVLEPNDHILTPACIFGARTAEDLTASTDRLKEYISSKQCRAILIGDDQLESQYTHYLGNFHREKLVIFPQMRCIPRRSPDEIRAHTTPPVFLFLASDFHTKAVSVALRAWRQRKQSLKGTLLLACPFVPDAFRRMVRGDSSVHLIPEAPLSSHRKRQLLAAADVTLAFTHTDGGANAWEGLEWGHAIITNTYHRSKYITRNGNGIVIPFKHEVYSLDSFGKTHNDTIFTGFRTYLEMVRKDEERGDYDEATSRTSDAINEYITDREKLVSHQQASLILAWQESIWASNSKLLDTYNNAASIHR